MAEGHTNGESYTVQEAARILRTTERTVRRRLARGDLEGKRDPISGRWKVEARSVTAAMSERRPRASQEAPESPESVREHQERVEGLQREPGLRHPSWGPAKRFGVSLKPA